MLKAWFEVDPSSHWNWSILMISEVLLVWSRPVVILELISIIDQWSGPNHDSDTSFGNGPGSWKRPWQPCKVLISFSGSFPSNFRTNFRPPLFNNSFINHLNAFHILQKAENELSSVFVSCLFCFSFRFCWFGWSWWWFWWSCFFKVPVAVVACHYFYQF